jgi:oxygen-independent coproporphyrinogen III oxidase
MSLPSLFSDLPSSVYVHVPFCVHRCGYCDFTLVAGKDHLADSYLDALELELRAISSRPTIKTLFVGGGTPTQVTEERLSQLLRLLENSFEFDSNIEFSVEANPIGFTPEKLKVLKDAGCNRISLGVQSFDADVLATLERDHRLEDINCCVEMVRSEIDNISLDLIFAVPGQSSELWNQTLQTAIDLAPQHLSTYGLTFEKGTSFWTRREHGALEQLGDEDERAMYASAMSKLESADFQQYEISSFARPGYKCEHNQVYWGGAAYWGFGPGAASFLRGHRILNHRSVTTWLKKTLAGKSAVSEDELLSVEDRARELLVLSLRRIAGVDKSEFEQRTGMTIESLAAESIEQLANDGLIEPTETGYRLTMNGRFLADTVAGELLVAD